MPVKRLIQPLCVKIVRVLLMILTGLVLLGISTDRFQAGYCQDVEQILKVSGDSVDLKKVTQPDQQQSKRDDWLNQAPPSLGQTLDTPAVTVSLSSIDISQFPTIIVSAKVQDRNKAAVGGLTEINFSLSEDSTTVTKQLIPVQASAGMAISLIIDRSGSLSGTPLDEAKSAAKQFIDAIGTNDRVKLIACSEGVSVLQPYSSDKTALKQAIDSLEASGQTVLHDAILRGVTDAANETGTKAVIVLTDGQDNMSVSCRQDEQCLVDLIKQQAVPVYAIGIGSMVNAEGLQKIAAGTNGYYLFGADESKIKQLYQDMDRSQTEAYRINYTSPKPDFDGTARAVALTVISSSGSGLGQGAYEAESKTLTITRTQATINLCASQQAEGMPVTISAKIIGPNPISGAWLMYRPQSSAETYRQLPMAPSGGMYSATLPGANVSRPGIDFYFVAADKTNTVFAPADKTANNPYRIAVLSANPALAGQASSTTVFSGSGILTAGTLKGASAVFGGSMARVVDPESTISSSSNDGSVDSSNNESYTKSAAASTTEKIVFAKQEASGKYDLWMMNPDGSSQQRLTDEAKNGIDSTYPSIFPDGKKLLYQRGYNIAVLDVATLQTTSLTTDGADGTYAYGEPRLSPDGTKIAYTYGQSIAGSCSSCTTFDIWMMNVDGSNITRITNNSYRDATPIFSPDGTKLLISHYQGAPSSDCCNATDIYIIDIATKNETKLYGSSYYDWGMAWGSAGILFTTQNGVLAKISPDGTGLTTIVDATKKPTWGIYSPDSTKILYQSNASGLYDLYTANADGTNPVQLTSGMNTSAPFAWGFVSTGNTSTSIKIAYINSGDLWITDEQGTTPVNLTNTPNTYKFYPRFSPDGQKIAYISIQSGRYELWVMNADGSNKTQITSNHTTYPAGGFRPAWSPDGQWLYFGSGPGGDCEVFKIKIDGTGLQQVTNVPGYNTMNLDISHDGTKATYVRGNEGNGYSNKLYFSNSDFSNAVEIQPRQPAHNPIFSPDDSKIVYNYLSGGEYNTYIINVDGTGDVAIAAGAYPNAWHPSGNKLLILEGTNLHWINTDGSNKTLVTQGEQGDVSETTGSLTQGLVAYYPFNGNANDESGNGHNGTISGNVTFGTDRLGVSGSAAYFDGSGSQVTIPHTSSLNSANGTWAAWVKLQGSTSMFIVDKDTYQWSQDGHLEVGVNNEVCFSIEDSTESGYKQACSADGTLARNQWRHITATWGNNGIKLYVNGSLVAQNSYTGGVNSPGDLIIGSNIANTNPANGSIDEVRIYNRALSASEVLQLYTTASGGTYSISGTVTFGGVGLSGVTMTLSGAGSGTATTDSTGIYTISGVANGSYTITPSKSGYTFTPSSTSVTVSGANQTGKDFTATTGSTSPLFPSSYGYNALSNTGSITVTPSSSTATWTAVSNVSWIIITSGAGGTGTGTISYRVEANTTGDARTGTITVGDQTFTIRQAKGTFNDVQGNSFSTYIYAIYTAGITQGCGSNNYCPSMQVTRGQMAAFIMRAKYGEDFTYTTTPYFSDVPAGHTFFKYVQKMKDTGVTAVSGSFLVDSIVTREQMAAFIIRSLYGENFSYTTTPYFTDVPATNQFFKYIQKMKDTCVTAVTGTYMPTAQVPREQMAAFLARAFLAVDACNTVIASGNTVGPDGGIVEVTSSTSNIKGTQVVLSAGSLSRNTQISIGESKNPPKIINYMPVNKVIDFGPDGTTFGEPATVTIPYDPNVFTDEKDLILKTYNKTTGTWEEVAIDNIDTVNHLVTAKVRHFSTFTVDWYADRNPYVIQYLQGDNGKLSVRVVLTKRFDTSEGAMGVDVAQTLCSGDTDASDLLWYYPGRISFKYVVTLMQKDYVLDNTIETMSIEYYQNNLGVYGGNYHVNVIKNGSQLFSSSTMNWDKLVEYYSGYPAIFNFDHKPVSGKKYYVKIQLKIIDKNCHTTIYDASDKLNATASFASRNYYDADGDGIVNAYEKPPSTPTGLKATAVSTSQIDLLWTANPASEGISSYELYRDAESNPFAYVKTGTTYSHKNLNSNTDYCYSIVAHDAANQLSGKSAQKCARTASTVVTLPVPTGVVPTAVSISQIDLSWNASTDTRVTGYKIYLNGSSTPSRAASGPTSSFYGLTPATSYCYQVSTYDSASHESAKSSSTCISTYSDVDVTAPTVPTGLSVKAVSSTQLNLSWTASYDARGVKAYRIYKNGSTTPFTSVSTTSVSDSSLTPSTRYCYQILAYDEANNPSAKTSQECKSTWSDTALTYSISGNVTIGGVGLQGVEVSLGGSATAKTTTDENGIYQFIKLANGSYKVTGALDGYSMTAIDVTVSDTNAININIIATPLQSTYSITGTITSGGTPLSGVKVDIGGTATASTITNNSGVYSFTGLANGSYTITPSKTGYTITAATVTVYSGNVVKDFTATAIGIVPSAPTGVNAAPGDKRITITWSAVTDATSYNIYWSTTPGVTKATGTKIPNVSAPYIHTGLTNGTTYYYVVTAVNSAGESTESQQVSATASGGTYSISGTVTSGGVGLSGVTLTLSGAGSGSANTDSIGNYTISGVANGSYTITPSKLDYTFTPSSLSLNVSGANQTEQNFTATAVVTPTEMVLIPAGSFQMGDNIDGVSWAMPVHTVTVSAFYLDKYEVTKALWDEVYTWATAHGYVFDNAGTGTAATHPVHTVSWYDVIKWLNARSEKEGRTPVYYTDAGQAVVYRTGQVDVAAGAVKWSANGYRLPTEAEWEYAARGGTTTRFYTGTCISTDQANYNGNYPDTGCPAGQYRGGTTAVGSFAANPWGLNDMAGNVWEWTWDWYGAYPSSSVTNPRGPDSGSGRVYRGGGWGSYAVPLRSAVRGDHTPSVWHILLGFRSATATSPVTPPEMVPIPAGTFQMGDGIDGMGHAMPVHTVTVSAFHLDKYETTKALWDEVYAWATAHGYTFDNVGAGTAANHPVQAVSWYDVVKWLNARSEKEGRTPVYYTNVAQTTTYIYKTGQVDVTNGMVKWSANGYRLPTEAEWEYAARGGTTTRFYTGSCIATDQANYNGNFPWTGCPAGQYRGAATVVGSFAANPWGLNDMVGNVTEWTWDWYGGYSSNSVTNPKGPDSGSYRVSRGGGWNYHAYALRSADRDYVAPSYWGASLGFRSAATSPVTPPEMVLIPAGTFQMGDAIDGMSEAMPVHTVTVSAFYLDKYEVTKALWDEVYTWATAHGYTFDYAGAGTAANHPVQSVSWYDVVKWLNARSEKEGRTPVYYTNVAQTTSYTYKTGQVDVRNSMVKWTANGYRLPTEAEWEYAARGGTTTRFYTGSCISADTEANYVGNDPESGCPAGQYRSDTTAVGSFPANPWGLNDMAGNVWEWTWDRYGTYPSSAVTNPRGPDSGSYRVHRGGSFDSLVRALRSAERYYIDPSRWGYNLGFRSALSQP
jgi:VWFA-related protein